MLVMIGFAACAGVATAIAAAAVTSAHTAAGHLLLDIRLPFSKNLSAGAGSRWISQRGRWAG
ncbi:hypothetical protein GCM10010109_60270 [Actinoplanes campanulatus]|nr:hypothetical protein GCM10010109_60270 [Actinoplanes campanulatus]GID39250.1 hypothetical protein Aca09nite_57560 [Actinoplanes campanulatus]